MTSTELASPVTPTGGELRVTVYSTGPGCMPCRLTRRAFAARGVRTIEVDVRNHIPARELVTALGYASAPVVVVEDNNRREHWSGLRPDLIDQVARRAHSSQRRG